MQKKTIIQPLNILHNDDNPLLPAEIVLAPSWWHKHIGITFDEDFFYHPLKRVESEKKMEQVLYERWGQFGLGRDRDKALPVIGGVHLAAGFLLQEMLGCKVFYKEDGPPQVIPANRDSLEVDIEQAFASSAYDRFECLIDALVKRYGHLVGDVNWSGVLNLALDIRGNALFLDMFDKSDEVLVFFAKLQELIEIFTSQIQKKTGTTSISVNRTVAHFNRPVFLHSICSHTLISAEDYQRFLMPIDAEWSGQFRPYGIHHCGPDAHRFVQEYAGIPHLDFLDVGWGSDVSELRRHLPHTFLNIRLSPVKILEQSEQEIYDTVFSLAKDSGDPRLTGFCCINMDGDVEDSKITTMFAAVEELRKQYQSQPRSTAPAGSRKRRIQEIGLEEKRRTKVETEVAE